MKHHCLPNACEIEVGWRPPGRGAGAEGKARARFCHEISGIVQEAQPEPIFPSHHRPRICPFPGTLWCVFGSHESDVVQPWALRGPRGRGPARSDPVLSPLNCRGSSCRCVPSLHWGQGQCQKYAWECNTTEDVRPLPTPAALRCVRWRCDMALGNPMGVIAQRFSRLSRSLRRSVVQPRS